MKLQLEKTYRLRDGRIIKLTSSFVNYENEPIFSSNMMSNHQWFEDGSYDSYGEHELDLIEELSDIEPNIKPNIDLTKRYKTKHGESVELICIRHDLRNPVIGSFNGSVYTWNIDGSFDSGRSYLDLVEDVAINYEIDDKVLVKKHTDVFWTRRHFAYIDDDGRVNVYTSGRTSHTTDGQVSSWDQCIRLEDQTPDMVIVNPPTNLVP